MAQYRRLRSSELEVNVTGASSRSKITLGVLLVCLFWWLFVVVLVLIASAPHFLNLRRVGWDKAVVLGEDGHEIGFGNSEMEDDDLDSATVVDLSVAAASSAPSVAPDTSVKSGSSRSSTEAAAAPVAGNGKPIAFLRAPAAAFTSVNFKIEPLLNRDAPSLEENAHRIMKHLVEKWTWELIDEAGSLLDELDSRSPPSLNASTSPVPEKDLRTAESETGDDDNDCSNHVGGDGGGGGEFVPCNLDKYVEDGGRVYSYVGLPLCPVVPENLVHERAVNLTFSANVDRAELNERLESSGVLSGGEWMPRTCLARHKVMIVIPYRDRAAHLLALLKELHALLQSQDLHYKIIVAEQMGGDLFNKGMLMNAGFLTAIGANWWDCVVFHDVDLVPEDGRNMYSCPPRPRHLSVAVDKLNYTLPYYYLMGGVVAFRTEHFMKVNGYSNLYWGWGGEDDDMGQRVLQSWSTIDRPLPRIGRYKMLPHIKRRSSVPTVIRRLLRTAGVRRRLDGLNSISFELVEASSGQRSYTRYLIDVGPPPETISKLADIQQRQWGLVKKLRRG